MIYTHIVDEELEGAIGGNEVVSGVEVGSAFPVIRLEMYYNSITIPYEGEKI